MPGYHTVIDRQNPTLAEKIYDFGYSVQRSGDQEILLGRERSYWPRVQQKVGEFLMDIGGTWIPRAQRTIQMPDLYRLLRQG